MISNDDDNGIKDLLEPVSDYLFTEEIGSNLKCVCVRVCVRTCCVGVPILCFLYTVGK